MLQKTEQYQEKTIHTEPIFSGKIISVQVDTVELPNGNKTTRELVRHPGAAAVLPIMGDKIVVVEQYRKPFEKFLIEIPAGKLDPNEDPLVCAARELEEETGYQAGSIRLLNKFYTSPGFADELLYLYVAEQLVAGPSKPDEDEFLAVQAITLDEALQLIDEGRIADAKTIMAVYAWRLYQLTGQI